MRTAEQRAHHTAYMRTWRARRRDMAHRHISVPEWCVAALVVLAWAVGLGWTPW